MADAITLPPPREVPGPLYFGIVRIPLRVEAGGEYEEWRSVIGAIQDGDSTVTGDDIGPLIELYVSLKRQNVRFWQSIEDTMRPLVLEYALGSWEWGVQ